MLRKMTTFIEETMLEAGRSVQTTWRLVAVAAIVQNPFAGQYVENLDPLIEECSRPLALAMMERALSAMGVTADQVTGVGKAALVGLDGEIEHGCAIIHTRKFADVIREAIDGSASIVSVEKRGAANNALDIPLKHKVDHTIRSHHMTYEIRVPDGPGPSEILVALALSNTGRPFARLRNPSADFS